MIKESSALQDAKCRLAFLAAIVEHQKARTTHRVFAASLLDDRYGHDTALRIKMLDNAPDDISDVALGHCGPPADIIPINPSISGDRHHG